MTQETIYHKYRSIPENEVTRLEAFDLPTYQTCDAQHRECHHTYPFYRAIPATGLSIALSLYARYTEEDDRDCGYPERGRNFFRQ